MRGSSILLSLILGMSFVGCKARPSEAGLESARANAAPSASSVLSGILVKAGYNSAQTDTTATCMSGITISCTLPDDIDLDKYDQNELAYAVKAYPVTFGMGVNTTVRIQCEGKGKSASCTVNGKVAKGEKGPEADDSGDEGDTGDLIASPKNLSDKIYNLLVKIKAKKDRSGHLGADGSCSSGMTVSCIIVRPVEDERNDEFLELVQASKIRLKMGANPISISYDDAKDQYKITTGN
jgi:hypothetical protein